MKHPKKAAICRSRELESDLAGRIRAAGLRPTRQRLALGRLLFRGCDRHVTAERLHGEALAARVQVSLATVYNTLRQFEAAGLLREVAIEPGRLWFDTNVGPHHHFFHEGTGELSDIPEGAVSLDVVPTVPPGSRITRVDVIVRVADDR